MAGQYQLAVTSKLPFGTIGGLTYSTWAYRLTWAAHPDDLQSHVGLILSTRIDVKDPADYPGVPQMAGMSRSVHADEGTQYLYRTIDPKKGRSADLYLIAPSAEDSFTPLKVATADADTTDWQSLSFTVDPAAPPAPTQMMRGPSASAGSPQPPTVDGQPLSNSSRRVPKATLVSLQLETPRIDLGGAVLKFGLVNSLRLQPGEVDAAQQWLANNDQFHDDGPPRDAHGAALADTLKAFEGAPLASDLPSPGVFTSVPAQTLSTFGKAIIALRRQRVNQLAAQQFVPQLVPQLAPQLAPQQPQQIVIAPAIKAFQARAIDLQNAAVVALNGFEQNFKVTPIGVLNLERIEMTPVGIERGALISTIPLAPLEQTAVVHKEWSVTTKEFESIVTDSLENFSETGVTENTELAQATNSQTSHSNQFNVNGTVTGGYGPVTATISSAFSSQNQESQSANESRKHAITTTRKASSRVKQEHKVTISTTTVTGTSETSTRVLQNPSTTNPIRIDYFSLMRKWHVGLYRYGLRLTYDIAIPEPASAMRKVYADLANLKAMLGPFAFSLARGTITRTNYQQLADQYNAQVPPPPDPDYTFTIAPAITVCPDRSNPCGIQFSSVGIPAIRDGYAIDTVTLDGGVWGYSGKGLGYGIVGTTFFKWDAQSDQEFPTTSLFDTAGRPFLHGATGSPTIGVFMNDVRAASIVLTIKAKLSDSAFEAWRSDVWNALFNAAQTQYFARQQDIQSRVSAIETQIEGVDTLTLRREENEEVMKGVLRWLLGPTFHFMPEDVVVEFLAQSPIPILNPNGNIDLVHGTVIDASRGDGLNVTGTGWYPMFMYQEMVKFINEAIEWENVLYFLYSYFWDVPPSWDFIRQIRHPDATRQAFLRAGSARVVLTVRRGWELAWVRFVEAGGFGSELIPGHPYLTIAKEIQDYDQTNYPGIPPANPGGGPLPDDGASVATVSAAKLAPNAAAVTVAVKSSAGFQPGYTAIIDTWDTKMMKGGLPVTAQETQVITAVPDPTHITVERIDNPHDGSLVPFPIMQGGEKGQIIAEWFEYTPTSGTDIAVTSNLADIA